MPNCLKFSLLFLNCRKYCITKKQVDRPAFYNPIFDIIVFLYFVSFLFASVSSLPLMQ